MSIFRINYDNFKNQGDKFVGFHVGSEMDTILNLYSLSEQTSKSSILRNIINQWIEQEGLNTDTMANIVAERAYHSFKLSQNSGTKTLEEFRYEFQIDLRSRNISEQVIKKVIDKFNEFIKKFEQSNEKES